MSPIRRRVIAQLRLQPGFHALDMGCGTGASFDALREAVGPTGRVTGVELTEDMAAVARRRVAERGWSNVDVVVGDATEVSLPSSVDGVLFFLTHDLCRTAPVIRRAVEAARPGARIVAFGPARATHRLRWLVNPIVTRFSGRYITTFEGFEAPWSHLEALLPDLWVRRVLGGACYVAVGDVPENVAGLGSSE